MVGPVQGGNFQLPQADPARQGQRETITDFMSRRIEELREEQARRPEDSQNPLDPRFTGIRFRPIDNPRVIQARVIDRETDEILREVPTTQRLRIARQFRETVVEFVGRQIDVEA